jgi:hypothetical protein
MSVDFFSIYVASSRVLLGEESVLPWPFLAGHPEASIVKRH